MYVFELAETRRRPPKGKYAEHHAFPVEEAKIDDVLNQGETMGSTIKKRNAGKERTKFCLRRKDKGGHTAWGRY